MWSRQIGRDQRSVSRYHSSSGSGSGAARGGRSAAGSEMVGRSGGPYQRGRKRARLSSSTTSSSNTGLGGGVARVDAHEHRADVLVVGRGDRVDDVLDDRVEVVEVDVLAGAPDQVEAAAAAAFRAGLAAGVEQHPVAGLERDGDVVVLELGDFAE